MIVYKREDKSWAQGSHRGTEEERQQWRETWEVQRQELMMELMWGFRKGPIRRL